MRQYQDPLAGLTTAQLDDFGENDSLAAASRRGQARIGNTVRQFLPALVDHVELIRAQFAAGPGGKPPCPAAAGAVP